MGTATDFATSLATGQVGEGRIANWLRLRGWNILPVYEVEIARGKGPRLFTPGRPVIATDMFAFRDETAYWIEAKTKSVFSWRRLPPGPQWETGIDLRHYEDYLAIDDATPWPVWLMFLHTQARPDRRDVLCDCPPVCPTGLFGNTLCHLRVCESHRSDRHGASGMVYWGLSELRLLAPIEEVPAAGSAV